MKSFEIISENLEKLYELTGLNSSRLCTLCKSAGLSLTTSTLSRLLNGGNTSIETLDSISQGIKLIPGYEWVEQHDLLRQQVFVAEGTNKTLTTENLKSHYNNLFIELHEIGWVRLNKEVNMQSILDFSIHTFKKSGFEIYSGGQEAASLRSGT